MPTVLARPALIDNLPAIVGLLAADVLGHGRENIGPSLHSDYFDAFEAIDDEPNQVFAVFKAEGIIIGCLQLSFIPGLSRQGAWRGQIESVRISSERRGDGLGQQMINWAIDTCRERGCRIIQLTSDKAREDAAEFYLALSFVASHEGSKQTI